MGAALPLHAQVYRGLRKFWGEAACRRKQSAGQFTQFSGLAATVLQ